MLSEWLDKLSKHIILWARLSFLSWRKAIFILFNFGCKFIAHYFFMLLVLVLFLEKTSGILSNEWIFGNGVQRNFWPVKFNWRFTGSLRGIASVFASKMRFLSIFCNIDANFWLFSRQWCKPSILSASLMQTILNNFSHLW